MSDSNTTNGLRDDVLGRLARWESLGRKVTASGAVIIARVPHVAPEAWLHQVYASVDEDDRETLSRTVPGYNATALSRLHLAFNGINLFSGQFHLFGRRKHYDRTTADHLPWELSTHHNEVKRLLPPGATLVGGSNALAWGVHHVELDGGETIAIDGRNPQKVLFRWPSLENCVLAEIERLSVLFDREGRVIDQAQLANFGLLGP